MRVFAAALACSAMAGVLIDVLLAKNWQGALHLLNYYTIHTNIIIAVLMVIRLLHTDSAPLWLNGLTTGATLWIAVTGLGYHFLLGKLYQPGGWQALANRLLHYVTPSGMLLYFMLSPTGDSKQMLYWFSYPLLYAAFTLVRGGISGYYPYWFLRPTGNYPEGNGSYTRVAVFLAVMTLSIYLLGQGMWSLRGLLSRA